MFARICHVLFDLIIVGVYIGAGALAFAAWTVPFGLPADSPGSVLVTAIGATLGAWAGMTVCADIRADEEATPA